jgi:hypothetical protein
MNIYIYIERKKERKKGKEKRKEKKEINNV